MSQSKEWMTDQGSHGNFKLQPPPGDELGYEPPISQPQNAPENYSEAVDLRGRPVNKSKTGRWKASVFIYAITLVSFMVAVGVPANLVPYLAATMHQPVATAATIVTNVYGTSYLLSVLGGFVADRYGGSFFTIVAGGTSFMLGLGVLVLSTAWSKLQPAPCLSRAAGACKPAGARYMAPLFVALYTIALGSGLAKPNCVAMGGDQFDATSPKEKKQSVHFFVYYNFSINLGFFIAFTAGVYLQDDVSRSWGYGFFLMLYAACFMFFLMGVNVLRHKLPCGSFLTRIAQVVVASFRKWNAPVPANPAELYNPAVDLRLKVKLSHTNNLRFLDRAAIIDEVDKNALVASRPDAWRLCSGTQVEEAKRLMQFVPVWITISPLTLVFAQISTFTVQQGQTLDRRLGPHFVIPPASLSVMLAIAGMVNILIYDRIFVPLAKRFTRCPYGLAPLQRLGISLAISILTMICAALVERKRLTYVREMHLQALPLGAYVLPMKFWYLLPQFVLTAQQELFMYIAANQFFYYESAQTTLSVGSSFTYSASALGYYFSTIIVNLTNHVTRHEHGGSWLEGQLNNGGLEKFYWLLAVFIGVDLILFMVAAHFYQYKHDWYLLETPQPETDSKVLSQIQLRRINGSDPPSFEM
ncbi:unnamed protein product [Calypogeia fissa]